MLQRPVPKASKPWSKWSQQKKERYGPFFYILAVLFFSSRFAREFLRHKNFFTLKLRFGVECPQRRTLNNWCKAVSSNAAFRRQGRPTVLSQAEEERLFNLVQHLRQHGTTINKLALQGLATECLTVMRGPLAPVLDPSGTLGFQQIEKAHHQQSGHQRGVGSGQRVEG